MRTIHYASATFRVGDALADALFEYAQELVRWGRSDSVVLVADGESGQRTRVGLILGPASVLAITDAEGPAEGLHDGTLVASLEDRRRSLTSTPEILQGLDLFDDLLWLDIPDDPTFSL